MARPGRTPASLFIRDWAPFALLLLAYELLRDASAWMALPHHDLSGMERTLMGGHEPTVVLQAVFYRPGVVGWQDVLGTAVYFLHFVVPAAVGLVFWLGDRARFHRFVASLVGVCGLAFATYLVAPTTPPWLAAPGSIHHVIDETLVKLRVPASLLWAYSHRDYNLYAAFPSLHAAFPLVATIHAWPHRKWLGPLLGGWTLLVWAMVVYLGEHLVLDVAAGIVFAIAATWAVSVIGRQLTNHPPRRRATIAAAQHPGRRPRPRRLAVVMSGGAALGAFQAGVIDVFARRAVVPDLIVGTSIGAINGAYWAFNPGSAAGQQLLDLWLRASASRLLLRRLPVIRHLVTGRGYLVDNLDLQRVIAGVLGESARIEGSAVPLAIVATEVSSGGRRVLRAGPLLPALLASSAVPGIFPPVAVDGELLVDGGVVANCDLEAAVEAGMTDVLAIDLLGDEELTGSHVWDVVQHAVGISLRRQTELELQAVAGRARVALLRPHLAAAPGFGDLRQTAQLYEMGRTAGERFLDAHLMSARTVLPGTLTYAPDSSGGPLAAPVNGALERSA